MYQGCRIALQHTMHRSGVLAWQWRVYDPAGAPADEGWFFTDGDDAGRQLVEDYVVRVIDRLVDARLDLAAKGA